ncbi:hypothetical protein BU16DRAFT_561785 [Lophium mytilinum]|uniref:Uncharacterized protein n=1 Tax=Lophium mytilinum TaxID=390894 RepID=A0A6A6QSW2_9PEZI|nr:hypothetical protein BU16DRAFT_561785 [Lophium mytilinum]
MDAQKASRAYNPDWAAASSTNSAGRPTIQRGTSSSYRPEDRVWLSTEGRRGLEGPFLVAKVSSPGIYILCFENGNPAKDGAEIEESRLSLAQ